MSRLETRFLTGTTPNLRLESRAEGRVSLHGHAAVFDSLSNDLGFGLRERIRPGAFSRTLREGPDPVALVDHDSRLVLGRRSAGTLQIAEDSRGLAVEIDMPEASYSKDLQESIRRGDVAGMSFGFRTLTDDWHMEDGTTIRELIDVDLFEVSVVTFPAYASTDVALRGAEAYRADMLAAWVATQRAKLKAKTMR